MAAWGNLKCEMWGILHDVITQPDIPNIAKVTDPRQL
jgi:hypothetical protein